MTNQAERPTIAVVILTFNEEENLAAALASVTPWASEVVVVDSFSTDRTVSVALAHPSAKVRVYQHAFVNYSAQWNWLLGSVPISSDWTLKLDADERVPQQFREEMQHVLANAASGVDGIYFRRNLFFMGQRLRWGGVRGNFDLRLWRTGRARFENRSVNEHAIVEGGTLRIKAAVEHRDAKSLGDWLRKHERYAAMEATEILKNNLDGELTPRLTGQPAERRAWFRRLFYRLAGRSSLYFFYRVIIRLGLLDGRVGIRYWFLHAAFLAWIRWMVEEAARTGRTPDIAWPARGKADARLVDPAAASPEARASDDTAHTTRRTRA